MSDLGTRHGRPTVSVFEHRWNTSVRLDCLRIQSYVIGVLLYTKSMSGTCDKQGSNQTQTPRRQRWYPRARPLYVPIFTPSSQRGTTIPSSGNAPAYGSSQNQYAHTPSPHPADSPTSSAIPPPHHAYTSGSASAPSQYQPLR